MLQYSRLKENIKEVDSNRIAVTVTGENHSRIKVSIGLREPKDFVAEGVPAIVTIPTESNTTVHTIPTVDDLSDDEGTVTVFILASDDYLLGDSWLARHFFNSGGGFVEGAQTKVGYV